VWYNSQFLSVGQWKFFDFNLFIVVMMVLLSLVAFSDWWRERVPVLLAIKAKSAHDWKLLAEIKETFQESELPFKIDVLDWNDITPAFRRTIEANGYKCLKCSILFPNPSH
jgi:hypothetical protein